MNTTEVIAKSLLQDIVEGRESGASRIISAEAAIKVLLESYGAAAVELNKLRTENSHLKRKVTQLDSELKQAYMAMSVYHDKQFNNFY